MKNKKHALLLVGSAKPRKSTSDSLGVYLLEKLREYGFETTSIRTHKAVRTDQGKQGLIQAIRKVDLIILSFPLYVDCLPYTAIRALEILSGHFKTEKSPKRFMAIANCGYPESSQNQTAIDICRQFARETGLVWVGGLSMGGGGAIAGKPLKKIKGLARNVIKSLDITAEALSRDLPVPEQAVELMAKQLIPRWLYRLISSIQFRNKARHYGMSGQLYCRPLLSEEKKADR